MFPGHPWEGEDFGAVEYEWYLARGYIFNVEFDVQMKPFIVFCKAHGHRSNPLIMKIATRLSAEFLPQRTVALNRRSYPARYPAGYVRPVRKGTDMLEHISVREKPEYFIERPIREQMQPLAKWMAVKHPRVAVWLARHVFPRHEVKDNYALMVTRNPLRGLGTRVVFHGTDYRTFILAIPFGDHVTCTFGAPHAFANIHYYEPFLKKFLTYMQQPESIPPELLMKPYREAPPTGGPPKPSPPGQGEPRE